MLVKKVSFILIIVSLLISCNTELKKDENQDKTGYVAVIDSSMTLLDVAKANNIGEPYLRTKLGIMKGVGKNKTLAELSRSFKFEFEDLRKIIEDRKNSQ